jgi:predicted alpha/beta-hydrolase family hydrolase
MDMLNLKYTKNKSDTLDIILPGSSGGVNYSLIQKIFDVCAKQSHSVASFNYPYFERGDERFSSLALEEEQDALKSVIAKLDNKSYKKIRLIGKSLGGVIASYYLRSLSAEEQTKYSIVIFGYVVGSVDLKEFKGSIDIIQGENDKYGSINSVKNDIKKIASKNISCFEIKGGDHSYKNESGEPIFEDEAIKVFKCI